MLALKRLMHKIKIQSCTTKFNSSDQSTITVTGISQFSATEKLLASSVGAFVTKTLDFVGLPTSDFIKSNSVSSIIVRSKIFSYISPIDINSYSIIQT